MSHAKEDLPFLIEEWSDDDKVCVEILARAGVFSVAQAAYLAALEERPRSRIVLRLGAHEMKNRPPIPR